MLKKNNFAYVMPLRRKKSKIRKNLRGGMRSYRGRYSTSSGKRRLYRKGGKRVSSMRAGSNVLVKDRTYIKMHYAITYTITSASTPQQILFAGNSLFDPDKTSSSGQPYGFDQWNDMYLNYLVLGSKIRFSADPQTNDIAKGSLQAVLIPNLGTASLVTNNLNDVSELPYSKTAVGDIYTSRIRLSNYFPTGKLFGFNPTEVKARPEFEALFSADPSTMWYWHCYVDTQDYNQSVWNAVARFEITYYCRLRGRRTNGPS